MIENEKIVFKLSKLIWNECKERELKIQQQLEEKQAELNELHKNLELKTMSLLKSTTLPSSSSSSPSLLLTNINITPLNNHLPVSNQQLNSNPSSSSSSNIINNISNNNNNNSTFISTNENKDEDKIQIKLPIKRGRKRKLLDDKITYQNLLHHLIRLRDTLSDKQLHSYIESKQYEQYLGGIPSLTKKELIQHLISLRVEYVQRLMRPIIQKIISHPRNADIFNHPVDHVALGLRDYLQRISRPMDLGTVRCNLLQGEYYTIDDFIKDVNLVFNNAISYNPSSHVIHLNAVFLKDEFQEDIKSLQDRLAKEDERKSQHYCDVCLGSTCVICNERCLKLEPTILVCYGPCGQRIKKQGTYYISNDGSLLWCQKCYSAANSVIVESYEPDHTPLLKKDLLKRKFDEEVVETWIECLTCSRRIHQICALYNNLHDIEAVKANDGDSKYYECPLCKLEITPESIKKNNSIQSKKIKSFLRENKNNNINTDNQDVCNEINKNDSDDCCLENMSRTFLPFSKLSNSDSISRTISFQEQPNIVQFGNININHLPSIKGQRTGSSDTSYESLDIHDRNDTIIVNNTFSSNEYINHDEVDININTSEQYMEDICEEEEDSMCVVTDNDAELDEDDIDEEIANVEKKLMLEQDHRYYDENQQNHIIEDIDVEHDNGEIDNDDNVQQEEKNIVDNRNQEELSSLKRQRKQRKQQLLQQCKVQTRSQSQSSQKQKQQSNDQLKSKKYIERIKKNQKSSSPSPSPSSSATSTFSPSTSSISSSLSSSSSSSIPKSQNPPKEQWKASRLPRTKLSDFIELMVGERLKQCGYEDVMKTLTIRMSSNSFHNFEVPDVITNNLPTSDGYHVNQYIYYKQKCILLFQNIDGIDVCLFCLYVQEFDDSCPEPNKSKVYIAYLDSVEYFRPRCVRTTVYHEILVAYLKWCQVRGFKQCHIWACPPQRGDNFIFWCHNPQQRNPSRDRLNTWYNTMLSRANQLGILKSIDTLWSSYFSNYGKRDELSQRTASKNSFVAKNSLLLAAKSGNNNNNSLTSDPPSPVCPPIFEGDFWVNECSRVYRLVQVRNKGVEGQDKNMNIRKCRDILKHIMSKPMAAAFNQPVDCILLNIPDYPTIVKEPMDLGTIRNKLRGNLYKTMLEFAKDVRLTFNNAMLYNPSGHPIHIYAKKLLEDFEQSLYDLVLERLGEMLVQFSDIDSNLVSYPLVTINPDKSITSSTNTILPTSSSSPSSSSLTPTLMTTRLSQNLNSEVNQETSSFTRHVSFVEFGDCKKECDGDDNIIMNQSSNSNSNHNFYEMGEGIDINLNINVNMIQIPSLSSNNTNDGIYECDGKNEEIDDMDLGPKLSRQDSTDSCLSLNESWSRRPDHTNSHVCSSSDSRIQNDRKIFEKSQLGQKGVITLMTELSRNVYRLKDDMYVITFNDPTDSSISCTSSDLLNNNNNNNGSNNDNNIKNEDDSTKKIIESSSNRGGKGRGKGLSIMAINSSTNHTDLSSDSNLTTISLNCLEYLKNIDQTLSSALNDPDNEFYCPFIDSRQTFLEICQYRHFQFDTLRRAKHSSIMLIYHLLYPYSQYTRPKCSLCQNIIQYVLWHCTECNLYWNTNHMNQNDNLNTNVCCHDICNVCYLQMKTNPNSSNRLHHELTPIRLTFV